MKTLHDRFMEKVSPEPISGCWLWTGGTDQHGYGRIWSGGKTDAGHKRALIAPRVSYQHHVGEIPDGMVVRHKCDNPACVAPHHLELGSHKENTQDMLSRGRANGRPDFKERDHCKNGHPFYGPNLSIINGIRRCKACQVAATQRYNARKSK